MRVPNVVRLTGMEKLVKFLVGSLPFGSFHEF